MGQLDDLQAGAVQHRTATVEDIDTERSEILLKAVPYEESVDIGGGIVETFKRGAFAKAAAAPTRLSLWRDHGGPLIGRGMEVDDRDNGVWFRAKLGRTTAAKDALLDLEDGIAADPSIEFRPLHDYMRVEARGKGFSVIHRRAHLLGVAIVQTGAYSGSAWVEAVREEEAERRVEVERAWLAEYRRRDALR